MLAAVQDAARRLCRCRGAASWTAACARRSAGRQVGTKGWPCSRTKGWEESCRGWLGPFVVGIEERLPFEQRAEDIEQSIADTAQRPPMTVTAPAQRAVVLSADRIVLTGATRPVIEAVA